MSQFFNPIEYLDKSDTEWRTRDISMIINAERNIGKSYGWWEYIDKEIWQKYNYKYRVAYLRTNLTKSETAREDFNSKYQGKYWMSKNKIYKLSFDEKGKELREQRLEIGSVCGVTNAENYKSTRFDNYVMIFWDEYNEVNELVDIWGKWIDLFKTIKRFNTPFMCVLVGNKVNANNDIMVKLELEPPMIDTGEDIHIERAGNIHFWDISRKTFGHLNNEDDMVNVWASYDYETDTYLNKGGYLVEQQEDVLIYRTKIEPTHKVICYLSLGEYKFEYGKFREGDTYIHKVKNTEAGYNVLALDTLGYMRDKTSVHYLDSETYEELATMLARKARAKKLFYSSFETKTLVEPFIIKMTVLLDE